MSVIQNEANGLGLKDHLSLVFREVVKGSARGEDKFPVHLLLATLDLSQLNEEEQVQLASILSYLRLIWVDRDLFDEDTFWRIADHSLTQFHVSPELVQQLLVICTSSPHLQPLLFGYETFVDWSRVGRRHRFFGAK